MAGSSLIGNLAVLLSMDTSAFERGATHAQRLMARTQRQFQQVGQRITALGAGLSVGITAPFAALMRTAIPAAIESRQAFGQVEAALASMGPAAGRTAVQLQAAAEHLQSISTFDDDDILRKVTANLLTFGRVSGTVFDRAQASIVNISARLGTDLQSATLMVGRALNDPIRGLTALRRSGIQFTEQQTEMITAMVRVGDIAGAQAVMLGELERQFGGAAQALRRATPQAEIAEKWRTFQEVVGEIALRVLPPLTDMLTRVLSAFNRLSPRMQAFVVGAVALAAALGPVMLVLGPMVGLVGRLLPLVVAFGPALGVLVRFLGPLGLAATAVYLAFQHWPRIRAWFDQAIGPQVRQAVEDISAALTALWQGPLGQGISAVSTALLALGQVFVSVLGAPLLAILSALTAAFGGTVRLIADFVTVVAALLNGDFSGAWRAAKALVLNVFSSIGNIINGIAPGAINAIRGIYNAVREWLVEGLRNAATLVRQQIERIAAPFRWLYDVVVGHSYIPDMVDEIGRHMNRLDGEMAVPVESATGRVRQSFAEMATGIVNSLKGIVTGIKSGDWLSALQGVLDIIGQVVAMTGGKGGSFNFGGFRAQGGPVAAGRGYIVGERGPEWFVPGRSGAIVPSTGGRPYFDLRGAVMTQDLLDQMNQIGETSAYSGAAMGSVGAQSSMYRRASRQIPSG